MERDYYLRMARRSDRVMTMKFLLVVAIVLLCMLPLLAGKGSPKTTWACWDEINTQMPSGTEHICAWIAHKPAARNLG